MWLRVLKVVSTCISVFVALALFAVGSQTLFFYATYGSAIIHHYVPLDRVMFAVSFWSVVTFGTFGIGAFLLGRWIEKRKKSPVPK